MALSPSGAAGLGSILDTAVKSAVSHLASVPEHQLGVDKGPSRVDFLYYEGNQPYYDYYYDYEDPSRDPVAPQDSLVSPPGVSPPPWAAHITPRPPHWLAHQDKFPVPRPPGAPPGNRIDRRQDRVAGAVSSLSRLLPSLPALIVTPIIAAISYYFVVLNGPTPVVKERWGEDVWGQEWGERWGGVNGLLQEVLEKLVES